MPMGHEISDLIHRSVIVPPATDRNAAPQNPAKARDISSVAIFCATADGICHTTD